MEAGRCSNPSGSGAPGRAGLFWRTFGSGAAAPFPKPPAGSCVPRGVAFEPKRSGPQRHRGQSAGSREPASLGSSGRRDRTVLTLLRDGLGGPAAGQRPAARRDERTERRARPPSFPSAVLGRAWAVGGRRGQPPHFFTPWRPLVASVHGGR